jgi:hypothetical protein
VGAVAEADASRPTERQKKLGSVGRNAATLGSGRCASASHTTRAAPRSRRAEIPPCGKPEPRLRASKIASTGRHGRATGLRSPPPPAVFRCKLTAGARQPRRCHRQQRGRCACVCAPRRCRCFFRGSVASRSSA